MIDDAEAIRARIAGITALAEEFAGASAQTLTDQIAALLSRDLTCEEFGPDLDHARAALETTASALCELREAALQREAGR